MGLVGGAGADPPPPSRTQTHIDIISDFDMDLVAQLQALATKHDFLIWEDRKFADIGPSLPPLQLSQLTPALQATPSSCNTPLEPTRLPAGPTLQTRTRSQATASSPASPPSDSPSLAASYSSPK